MVAIEVLNKLDDLATKGMDNSLDLEMISNQP